MVFSSILFMFIYLPVVLALYYIAPVRWRNPILFVANLVFYGWGEPVFIVLMLFSITGTFKDAALSSADLSSTSKTVISEQASIGFMPDAAFAKYIADKATNADDAAVLTAINRSTRQNSTQLGLYVLGFICALFWLSTGPLPNEKITK